MTFDAFGDEYECWWVRGYIFVPDAPNVPMALGPFDSYQDAIDGVERAKHGVVHIPTQEQA